MASPFERAYIRSGSMIARVAASTTSAGCTSAAGCFAAPTIGTGPSFPHTGRAGARDGYIALLQDVTTARRAAAALARQAEFEQHLIGIVRHDLRNPLHAILGSAAVLARRAELSEPAARDVVRIQRAADRALRMVRDLLDFTQARLGGGLQIAPRTADLHTIVRAVVDDGAVTARAARSTCARRATARARGTPTGSARSCRTS